MCPLLIYFSAKAGQCLSLNRLSNLQESSNCNIFRHLNLNWYNPLDPGIQASFHVHAFVCPQDGRLYVIFPSLQGLKRTSTLLQFWKSKPTNFWEKSDRSSMGFTAWLNGVLNTPDSDNKDFIFGVGVLLETVFLQNSRNPTKIKDTISIFICVSFLLHKQGQSFWHLDKKKFTMEDSR